MDRPGSPPRAGRARTLATLTACAGTLAGVRRSDLVPGDRVLVATRNSVYSLTLLPDLRFRVAGGCFRRAGTEQVECAVAGCSAGGSALLTTMIAAPGLFLELEDGTRTTRIQRVHLLPAAAPA